MVDGFEDEVRLRLGNLERSVAVVENNMEQINMRIGDMSLNYKVLNENHLDTQNKLTIMTTKIETSLSNVKFGFVVLGVISTILGIIMYFRGIT